jgi:hypothetical protein
VECTTKNVKVLARCTRDDWSCYIWHLVWGFGIEFLTFLGKESHLGKCNTKKIGAIMWKNLFKDQELIGKSLRVGFTKVIDGVGVD